MQHGAALFKYKSGFYLIMRRITILF